MTAQEVRAIGQISAAIRGSEAQLRERPLTAIDVAMISPLRCAAEQCQCLLECARRGLPIEVLTAPAMGLTAPITLAGSAALAIAEAVAALCLVYLVEPGLGIINTTRVQPVNMRTAAVNYGAPELGMASVLVAACCARYHLPCNLYGFGSTAGMPGIQATMERTLSGLLMALGHAHMITGSGLLHNGLVTSPEQLVIDDEVIRFLKRIQRPIPIAEESLGIGALLEGMAGSGTMVAEEHTLRHLRAGEIHQAGLGQWTLGAQGDALDLFDLAHTRVEEILASHTVAPFDARTEARIQGIMERWAG